MNPLTDLPQIFTWEFSRTTGMFFAGLDNSNVYFYREILVSGKAGFLNYSLKMNITYIVTLISLKKEI